jgi:hypothetical protein
MAAVDARGRPKRAGFGYRHRWRCRAAIPACRVDPCRGRARLRTDA